MKTALMSCAAVALLTACGTPVTYQSVYPELNPAGGLTQAQDICNAKSQAVSGYDWIDAMVRRGNALDACMLEYGYKLQAVRDTR
jgi:hypothetical protein